MKIQKQYLILTVLMAAMAFVLCACGTPDSGIVQGRRGTGKKPDEVMAQEAQEVQEADTAAAEEALEEDLYVLTRIDTEQKLASFQKVSDGRQSQYAYHTGTRFLDKYGSSKSADSFLPGDAVQIAVSGHTQQLTSVQQSPQAWVQDDIVNYSFDAGSRMLIIGRTKYACDPEMEIFSGEDTVGFDEIGEADVLRAVGRDKELISLSVTKGHGYLALSGTKLFEGSFICIGDKIFKEVTKNMQVEVPEGKYLVTVANNGYGGSREVEILRDQATSLNLDELKGEGPKICRITFRVGVEGAVLWIDGKKADYSKPVEVRYGVHTIAVEADGYDTIEKRLVVNSPESEIEIALSEAGKTSSDEKSAADAQTGTAGGQSGGTGNQNSAAGSNNNNSGNNNNNNNSNSNNNNNSSNNNNSNNNNNNNNNNNSNNNQSQTDYLTTLYNLLTSINNNSNNSGSGTGNHSSDTTAGTGTGDSYDDLRDQ